MNKIPGDTYLQKIAVVVACVSYTLMVPFLGLLAYSDFQDAHLFKTGTIVQATILTVSRSKGGSFGWVDYQLPNGAICHDWTKLAPHGVVHPGKPLSLAVDGRCGHPVSTKKNLEPWLYLCLFIGSFWPLHRLWRLRQNKVTSHA